MKKYLIFILLFSFLITGCSSLESTRYECQSFENWDEAKCNPPVCYQDFLCTKDLYPQEFWDSLELENQVPEWVKDNFKQYADDQNFRFIEALFNGDTDLQERIKEDAERVGYLIVPTLYLGGNKNEEQI